MADVRIPVQVVNRDGLEALYATDTAQTTTTPPMPALTTTDTFLVNNDGRTILHVMEGDTADLTVTIETPGQVDGLDVADREVTVTQNEQRFIGPFPPSDYNVNHDIRVTLGAVASNSVVALRI